MLDPKWILQEQSNPNQLGYSPLLHTVQNHTNTQTPQDSFPLGKHLWNLGTFNHVNIAATLKCTSILNEVLVVLLFFVLVHARGVRRHGFQSEMTDLVT